MNVIEQLNNIKRDYEASREYFKVSMTNVAVDNQFYTRMNQNHTKRIQGDLVYDSSYF